MLSPEYLQDLPEKILALYGAAEQKILADMARRISTYEYWIPAAEYQRQKLLEAGVVQDEILRVLSEKTRYSEKTLRSMMQQAASRALQEDAAVYEAAGMRVPSVQDSEPLRKLLNAGYRATANEMKNLCRTTARTATKQFEDALDLAWMKVHSGAFDANTAVRDAVKSLAEQGIHAIRYPSGRTDSIEVAVRRATVTGVNQTCCQLQEELADELGCDLVEVSAHAGARPDHALWQGKVYSRSGKSDKYPDFRSATGYGTGAGLAGYNCRHSFGPYIEGGARVWTDEKLAELDAPKYEYNGNQLNEYEAQQLQRKNERDIRRWKREYVAMEAAGLDTSEAAAKLKAARAKQADFLRKTGMKRQHDREQIKVAKTEKNDILKVGNDTVHIGSIDRPIAQRHTGIGNPNAILHFDVDLNKRQQRILDALPEYNSQVIVPKKAVSMADLSALTAKTGDEFAMFTRKGTRLVVRGNHIRVEVNREKALELAKEGYKWSGHTHPGVEPNCLLASRGDVEILKCFCQDKSCIYNSAGAYADFGRE